MTIILLPQDKHFIGPPGGDNEDFNVNGLTLDTVYYVIVQDSDYIKLAANATDAANGIFITLSDGGWSTNRAF